MMDRMLLLFTIVLHGESSVQSFAATTTNLHCFQARHESGPTTRTRHQPFCVHSPIDRHARQRRRTSFHTCCFATKKPAIIVITKKPNESTPTTTHDSTSLLNTQNNTFFFGFPNNVAAPLSLLLFSQFILFCGVGAVIPSIPLYGKVLGLDGTLNGIVISAPAVAALLGSKVAGTFADQARKPAMLLGMLIIIISDVGTALANSLFTLTLARLGLGMGRIISESGERGMLADLCNVVPETRGRALAAQQAVIALGIAIGAPAGGVIVEEYGPRASFLCVSAAASVAFLLYLFLPETVNTNENDCETTTTTTTGETGEWTILLKENKWKGLALCQVGASCGFAAKIASIPILAADALPGGAIGAGALLSAAGLVGLIGAPIGGWLTDQTSAKSTAILSGLVSATGLLLIPFALDISSTMSVSLETISIWGMSGSAAAFSMVVLLWSMGAAAQGPALTAFAQELAPAGQEATAMALPRAAGDGTYIVAPLLLGLVSDLDTSVAGTDCAAAGVMGLLGVLALLVLGANDNGDNDE